MVTSSVCIRHTSGYNLGQVVHTYVSLVTKQYNLVLAKAGGEQAHHAIH